MTPTSSLGAWKKSLSYPALQAGTSLDHSGSGQVRCPGTVESLTRLCWKHVHLKHVLHTWVSSYISALLASQSHKPPPLPSRASTASCQTTRATRLRGPAPETFPPSLASCRQCRGRVNTQADLVHEYTRTCVHVHMHAHVKCLLPWYVPSGTKTVGDGDLKPSISWASLGNCWAKGHLESLLHRLHRESAHSCRRSSESTKYDRESPENPSGPGNSIGANYRFLIEPFKGTNIV